MLAIEPTPIEQRWARITAHAPELAATCHHYVAQVAVSLRPASVDHADRCLRLFADWLIELGQRVLHKLGVQKILIRA